MSIAVMVTHSELTMNGKNPNCPSIGDHCDEVIKLMKEWFCESPEDLMINPVPIASGKSRKKLRDATIHFDESESIIFR